MTIRAVVFDIGGVLEYTEPMQFERVWEQRLGLPDGEIVGRLADVWRGGSLGTVTEDAVHRAVGERLGLDPATARALLDDMWVEYLGTGNTDLIRYVAGLRGRVRTGILSNSFVGAREREQQSYGFADVFDVIVYSHEVGLAKPDPRAYRLVCDRLGVAPVEAVHVDDMPFAVEGARTAGMRAIQFVDNAQVIAEIEALVAGAGTG
jgi:putative hydrolase of the HAD superfamily